MSPQCRNCNAFVSKDYARVLAPDDLEARGEVRACPYCTQVRDGGEIRQARSRGAEYQSGEIE